MSDPQRESMIEIIKIHYKTVNFENYTDEEILKFYKEVGAGGVSYPGISGRPLHE